MEKRKLFGSRGKFSVSKKNDVAKDEKSSEPKLLGISAISSFRLKNTPPECPALDGFEKPISTEKSHSKIPALSSLRLKNRHVKSSEKLDDSTLTNERPFVNASTNPDFQLQTTSVADRKSKPPKDKPKTSKKSPAQSMPDLLSDSTLSKGDEFDDSKRYLLVIPAREQLLQPALPSSCKRAKAMSQEDVANPIDPEDVKRIQDSAKDENPIMPRKNLAKSMSSLIIASMTPRLIRKKSGKSRSTGSLLDGDAVDEQENTQPEVSSSNEELLEGQKRSSKIFRKLRIFQSKRHKSGESIKQNPVVEEHGVSLFSTPQAQKRVNCIEPAEEAEAENIVHITDLPLVRSSSNTSFFVDIPEPIPETQGNDYAGSESDYQSPQRASTSTEEEFEEFGNMEDQVRVLSLPTQEDYKAEEERIDHMRQESRERLRSTGEEAGTLDHEKIDDARASEAAELLKIPPENLSGEKVSIDEVLDQEPSRHNIGSLLEQQREDEIKQLEYEEGAGEKHEETKKKKKNKGKKKGNPKKPMKHALSTESIEKGGETKKPKIDEETPVQEEFMSEKGGYEDELEASESVSEECSVGTKKKPIVRPLGENSISLKRVSTPPSFKVPEVSGEEEGEFTKEEGGYEDENEADEDLNQEEDVRVSSEHVESGVTAEHGFKNEPEEVKEKAQKQMPESEAATEKREKGSEESIQLRVGEKIIVTDEEHVEIGTTEEHCLKNEMEDIMEEAQKQMLEADDAMPFKPVKPSKKQMKTPKRVTNVEVPPSEFEHIESGTVEEHTLKNLMEEINEAAQMQMLEAYASFEQPQLVVEQIKKIIVTDEEHVEIGTTEEHCLKNEMEDIMEEAQKQMLEADAAMPFKTVKPSKKQMKTPKRVTNVEVPPSEFEHIESGTVEEHTLKNLMEEINEAAQMQMLEAYASFEKPQLVVEQTKISAPLIHPKSESSNVDEESKQEDQEEDKRIGFEKLHMEVEKEQSPGIGFEPLRSETERENAILPQDEKRESSHGQLEGGQGAEVSEVEKFAPEGGKAELETKIPGEIEDVSTKTKDESEKGIGAEETTKAEKSIGTDSVIAQNGISSEDQGALSTESGSQPVHIAESEEKIKAVCEEIKKIREKMELIASEAPFEEEGEEEAEEKEVAAHIIDENPKVNPADVMKAFKELSEFAEMCASEAVSTMTVSPNKEGEIGVENPKAQSDSHLEQGVGRAQDIDQQADEEEELARSAVDEEDEIKATEAESESADEFVEAVTTSTVSKPSQIAEEDEKVQAVCEDIKKICEEIELMASEAPVEELEQEEAEESEIAAHIIDENPDVSPVEVMKAFKDLGDFAEMCVSEAISEMKAPRPSEAVSQRRQRSDTVESYGFTYEDEYGTDSGDEQTLESVVEVPKDREVAASESGERLRKWSTGVEPHVLEDLPEADRPRAWEEGEMPSVSKGELEPHEKENLARVGLKRTEVHPSILAELNSEFVDKVLELPLVDTGLSYAYLLYTSVKGTCPRVVQRLMFDTTEKSAWIALNVSRWALRPFSRQLHTLDHMAANCLEIVENRLLSHAA